MACDCNNGLYTHRKEKKSKSIEDVTKGITKLQLRSFLRWQGIFRVFIYFLKNINNEEFMILPEYI